MKPLLLLFIVFIFSSVILRILFQSNDIAFSARIAMSAMLLFTSAGHFAFTKGMSRMIPGFIPFKTAMVYLTGVIEIVAAIGLLIPASKVGTAWALMVFFALLLLANIYAAMHNVDYQKGTNNGSGPKYLWFRIPLQILFIAWVYVSSIKY